MLHRWLLLLMRLLVVAMTWKEVLLADGHQMTVPLSRGDRYNRLWRRHPVSASLLGTSGSFHWDGESRHHYALSGSNVGLVIRRHAVVTLTLQGWPRSCVDHVDWSSWLSNSVRKLRSLLLMPLLNTLNMNCILKTTIKRHDSKMLK